MSSEHNGMLLFAAYLMAFSLLAAAGLLSETFVIGTLRALVVILTPIVVYLSWQMFYGPIPIRKPVTMGYFVFVGSQQKASYTHNKTPEREKP